MEEQKGDNPRPVFSFTSSREDHPKQVSCFITHTNKNTHEIILGALKDSPMYSGTIQGVGPRYCPSIEDKVVKFSEKPRHQIFVEPEGLRSKEVYPNGISTSIPFGAQIEFVRKQSITIPPRPAHHHFRKTYPPLIATLLESQKRLPRDQKQQAFPIAYFQ